jgi:indolepyruvate ferredoxin oxidoreductase, beta subunit
VRCDIVAAGVGGQGVLLVARCLALAALHAGLSVKQSETHGMARRGGPVVSHVRIADAPVHSPLVSTGGASLLLGFELLETVRSLNYLAPAGGAIVSLETVPNVVDYPDPAFLIGRLRGRQGVRLLDPRPLAREAGSARASNVVLLGAASAFLPIPPDALRDTLRRLFRNSPQKVGTATLRAFELGRTLDLDHGPATD